MVGDDFATDRRRRAPLLIAVGLLVVVVVGVGIVVERSRNSPPRVDPYADLVWGTTSTYNRAVGRDGAGTGSPTGLADDHGAGGSPADPSGTAGVAAGDPTSTSSLAPSTAPTPPTSALSEEDAKARPGPDPCRLFSPRALQGLLGSDPPGQRSTGRSDADPQIVVTGCEFLVDDQQGGARLVVLAPPFDQREPFWNAIKERATQVQDVDSNAFYGRLPSDGSAYQFVAVRSPGSVYLIAFSGVGVGQVLNGAVEAVKATT